MRIDRKAALFKNVLFLYREMPFICMPVWTNRTAQLTDNREVVGLNPVADAKDQCVK